VGASSTPFSEYRKKPGERVGAHWRIPAVIGKRGIRHVLIDTNHWKTFIWDRFLVGLGGAGCLSLYQSPDHRMLADQLTAEYPVEVQARGRAVNEWKEKKDRDNHLFDCLVGCAVAASMLGCAMVGMTADAAKKPRKKYTQIMLRPRR